jgi:hypothetical protein
VEADSEFVAEVEGEPDPLRLSAADSVPLTDADCDLLKLEEGESRADELDDTDSRALLLTSVVLGDAEASDDTLADDDALVTADGVILADADADEGIVRDSTALGDIALEELRDTVDEMVGLSRGGRDPVVEIVAVAEFDRVMTLALAVTELEKKAVPEKLVEIVGVDCVESVGTENAVALRLLLAVVVAETMALERVVLLTDDDWEALEKPLAEISDDGETAFEVDTAAVRETTVVVDAVPVKCRTEGVRIGDKVAVPQIEGNDELDGDIEVRKTETDGDADKDVHEVELKEVTTVREAVHCPEVVKDADCCALPDAADGDCAAVKLFVALALTRTVVDGVFETVDEKDTVRDAVFDAVTRPVTDVTTDELAHPVTLGERVSDADALRLCERAGDREPLEDVSGERLEPGEREAVVDGDGLRDTLTDGESREPVGAALIEEDADAERVSRADADTDHVGIEPSAVGVFVEDDE